MILLKYHPHRYYKKLPKYLYHDPLIANNEGMTMAHIFAYNRKYIPPEWNIPKDLLTNNGSSV